MTRRLPFTEVNDARMEVDLNPIGRCYGNLSLEYDVRGSNCIIHPRRRERSVRFRAGWLRPEEQHPADVEATLHPGGADPGDRLYHAHTGTRPQVSRGCGD